MVAGRHSIEFWWRMGWKKLGAASRLKDPRGRVAGTVELLPPVRVFGVVKTANGEFTDSNGSTSEFETVNHDAPQAQRSPTESPAALSPEEEESVKSKLRQFIAPEASSPFLATDVAPPLKYAPVLRSTLTLPGPTTKNDGSKNDASFGAAQSERAGAHLRYMRPLMALMLFIGLGVGAVLSLRPAELENQASVSEAAITAAGAISVKIAADTNQSAANDTAAIDAMSEEVSDVTEPLPVTLAAREFTLAGANGRLSRPRFDLPNSSWSGATTQRGPLSIRDFTSTGKPGGRFEPVGSGKGSLAPQWQGGWRLDDPNHNLSLGSDYSSYVGNQLGSNSLNSLSSLSSNEATILDKIGARGAGPTGFSQR